MKHTTHKLQDTPTIIQLQSTQVKKVTQYYWNQNVFINIVSNNISVLLGVLNDVVYILI
jgi:hypothetical protein